MKFIKLDKVDQSYKNLVRLISMGIGRDGIALYVYLCNNEGLLNLSPTDISEFYGCSLAKAKNISNRGWQELVDNRFIIEENKESRLV